MKYLRGKKRNKGKKDWCVYVCVCEGVWLDFLNISYELLLHGCLFFHMWHRKSEKCSTPVDWNRRAWRYHRADRDRTGREQLRSTPTAIRISGKNGSNSASATNWTRAPSAVTRSLSVRLQRKTCCALPGCLVTYSTTSLKSSFHPTVLFVVVSCSTATKPVRLFDFQFFFRPIIF